MQCSFTFNLSLAHSSLQFPLLVSLKLKDIFSEARTKLTNTSFKNSHIIALSSVQTPSISRPMLHLFSWTTWYHIVTGRLNYGTVATHNWKILFFSLSITYNEMISSNIRTLLNIEVTNGLVRKRLLFFGNIMQDVSFWMELQFECQIVSKDPVW